MLSSWNDFLTMLAQVAVALLALLFVSFQIARDRWVKRPARKLVAIQTLFEFLTPSFFAIIALLPLAPFHLGSVQISVWQVGGVLTGILGLGVSIAIIRYGFANHEKTDKFLKGQLRLQPLAVFEYVLVLTFSALGSLPLASIIMVWLLFSGLWETWMFFSELE